MTEIDFDTKFFLQSPVLKEEDVVVERDRFHLRKSFLHAHESTLDISDRYREDFLKECLAQVAISENK